jgi:hypothetical protein
MLYLESKWASLIPFAKVAALLKEVLPVDDSVNSETVRNHMQATAERIELALGGERQLNQYEGSEKAWEEQPLPDGPITVGIDGGYVRAAHKQGCFEVIAGKSIVAFRREEATNVPSTKCFGFVQIYDDKPRRRLWELLKSQGMQENQQVVFMSDGGEDVRRVQQYLHPFSEHLLDWFHITMRLTVLQQQVKGLQQERPQTGVEVSKQLESIKHYRWHGNTPEALELLTSLSIEMDMIREHSAPAAKVATGVADFQTYIKNNCEFIPNFGDRWRQGERISTGFVESTINQVVSRRSNRCSGHCEVLISCSRHEPRFSTMNWRKRFGNGTRGSVAKRPDPRLFGELEEESSVILCDRLSRTRAFSQRQLPTDHDYAT